VGRRSTVDVVSRLYQIQEAVRQRAEEVVANHPSWPCRKGCDDCCRQLASVPRVTGEEWQSIAAALSALSDDTAELVRRRIRESADAPRPVICPLLDRDSGTCLVYEARPVACRAYGFYAEREYVLGCSRIESIGQQFPEVVWGNHAVLEDELRSLGADATLPEWLGSENRGGVPNLRRLQISLLCRERAVNSDDRRPLRTPAMAAGIADHAWKLGELPA